MPAEALLCPVLPFAREKARQLVSVIVLGVTRDARYEGSRRPFVSIPPSVLELRLVNQSINQSHSCQSLHMLAIIARQVTRIRANSFSPTRPVSRAWFSPSSMRCLRPCMLPVRLFSVYSLRVQPSIRQGGIFFKGVFDRATTRIRHTLVPHESASAYWPICGATHLTPVLWERGPWLGEPRLAHTHKRGGGIARRCCQRLCNGPSVLGLRHRGMSQARYSQGPCLKPKPRAPSRKPQARDRASTRKAESDVNSHAVLPCVAQGRGCGAVQPDTIEHARLIRTVCARPDVPLTASSVAPDSRIELVL
eukprot:scaffold175_cov150-Isochrysis_galbana.AAC.6